MKVPLMESSWKMRLTPAQGVQSIEQRVELEGAAACEAIFALITNQY